MATQPLCKHDDVLCLNQYELIRKYRCSSCKGVMMCACDEPFGRRFLDHQLDEGCELETQRRVAVTHGFQLAVCKECRGLPADAAPHAEGYGYTTKVRRYYWREHFFETERRFADWSEANPGATNGADARGRIDREVAKELQALHERAPKYVFDDLTQAEVIERYDVDVMDLRAKYLKNPRKGHVIDDRAGGCSAEAFATRVFEADGWRVMTLESTPFHVLFAVLGCPVVQDDGDQDVREAMFGARDAYEQDRRIAPIATRLPVDFGTKGFAERRAAAIDKYLATLPADGVALRAHFEHWLPRSEGLRQYLWAQDPADIERAQQIIGILPPSTIVTILRYLFEDYYRNFCGWPDLLLYRADGSFLLAEVKSSKDKLGEDQKRWIGDNHDRLHLPFKLVKIHKLPAKS